MSNEPVVSYGRVISLYLATSDVRKSTVGDCSPDDFRAFVRAAVATTADPEAAMKGLEGLTYDHAIDKWWAVSYLLEAGAALPLFDAMNRPVHLSHGPRVPGRSHDDVTASGAGTKRTGLQAIDPGVEYRLALPGRL